jgi:cell division topological specificity factor
MFDLLQKLFGKEPPRSKDVAKERLRLVLVHDRVNVSPQFMEVLKEDMIKAISNYMEINERIWRSTDPDEHVADRARGQYPVNRMKRGAMMPEIAGSCIKAPEANEAAGLYKQLRLFAQSFQLDCASNSGYNI